MKLGKVSKGSSKFFLAGKGMSVRTGRFIGESALVGNPFLLTMKKNDADALFFFIVNIQLS